MGKFIDLTGRQFGELTVIGLSTIKLKNRPAWLCKCDCGGERIVAGESLKNGDAATCGNHKSKRYLAVFKESGKKNRIYKDGFDSHSRVYHVWRGMMKRCEDPGHHAYCRNGPKTRGAILITPSSTRE